jgi:hypothetical protein
MGANTVRVNQLDEVKGVSEEALDSGTPMSSIIGVPGTWPASPTRSGYLDLHRYLLPRHVHTEHRSSQILGEGAGGDLEVSDATQVCLGGIGQSTLLSTKE